MKLTIQTDNSPILQKTKELCQIILDQPAYQEMRAAITAFVSNAELTEQYKNLCDQQETLHAKYESGQDVTDEEMKAFETLEHAFLNNPQAQAFIDVQQKMHKTEKTITQYIHKTFELGRVPTSEDFESGSCGPSCGCHG